MGYRTKNRWKELRCEVLKRTDGRCQLCNSDDNIHIHHRVYDARYDVGCKDASDLTALCQRCHFWFHKTQWNQNVSDDNRVSKYRGKKERKKKYGSIDFPQGLEYKLEVLIEKHIDIDSVTTKEFKSKVRALQEAILMGAV